MQTGATQPEPFASAGEGASTQRNKRRSLSVQSSSRASAAEADEAGTALPPSQSSANRRSPRRGSSREMTPPDSSGAVRYTRTGRVSRAHKGQRVHQCEECGKIYTRAEHLRRHQQNHKPGAYPCDIAGCGRSFYREDLLLRHKSRQHEVSNPNSVLPPSGNQDSTPPVEPTSQLPPFSSDVRPPHRDGVGRDVLSFPQRNRDADAEPDPRTQKRFPDAASHQYRYLRPSPICSNDNEPERSGYWSDSSSVTYSTADNIPPTPLDAGGIQYPQLFQRERSSSNASYLEYSLQPHTSHPSVSPGLSLAYPLPWSHPDSFGIGAECFTAFTASQDPYNTVATCQNNLTDPQLLSEYRDLDEQVELGVNIGTPEILPFDMALGEPAGTLENQYLQAYWTGVHSLLPIVHRSSFDSLNTSPLLKAAMLALGANAQGNARSKTYARTVHERCIKVLHKRTMNGTHSLEICDMQAIVLIEIYSIFMSRRPPLHFSKHFEEVYRKVTRDAEALAKAKISFEQPQGFQNNLFCDIDNLSNGASYTYDSECRQRLVVACYILDQQHALLFGRLRLRSFPNTGATLPYPRSAPVWEAQDGQQAPEELLFDSGWPSPVGGLAAHTSQNGQDCFQSMFSLASSIDSDTSKALGTTDLGLANDSRISHILQDGPRMQLAYYTLMLCKTTPVRDLLAVVGESWVMSEKLVSPADHAAAQLASLEWAKAKPRRPFHAAPPATAHLSVREAVYFARQILQIHQKERKTGLLFHEWSLYLATIVLWASAYVDSSGVRRASAVVVAKSDSSAELERSVSAVVNSARTGQVGLEAAMGVLVWTKNKIHAVDLLHHCGLTSGALDVLGKLIARGSEPGWFAS